MTCTETAEDESPVTRSEPDLKQVITRLRADYAGPIAELIEQIVRRSHLRRREKVTVAEELMDYFRQGLTEGVSRQELLATFGDARQAAKLIRRAKVRCRSRFDRLLVGTLLSILLVAVVTGVLFAAGSDPLYVPISPEAHPPPTSDITGVVKDESGDPIAGIEVLAVKGWDTDGKRLTAVTTDEGRFTFAGLEPEGYWFFSVDHPDYGWEWDHERALSVPAKVDQLPVEITLFKPRTLRGTVVDEQGGPVADVRVVMINQRLPGREDMVSGHCDRDFLIAQTDEAGRFSMERVRPGTAVFALEHPAYANTLSLIDVDDSAVELTIDKGLTLHGRVVHEGEPVPGVRLAIDMDAARRPIVQWRGESDAEGRFEAPRIPPRSVEDRSEGACVYVRVDDDAWTAPFYGVYQQADGSLPQVTVEAAPLAPGQAPVRERVAVGKPAESGLEPGETGTLNVHVPQVSDGDVSIYILSADAIEPPISKSQPVDEQTATFEGLAPDRYVVSTLGGAGKMKTALLPKTVEVAAGRTTDVTLETGACRVTGVVRSGGEPVGGGWVCWFIDPHLPRTVFQGGVVAQADGRYTIDGLMPGTYRFNHQLNSGMLYEIVREIPDGTTTLDFDLPAGRIEGRLVGITPKLQPDLYGDGSGMSNSFGRIDVFPRGFPSPMPPNTGCSVEVNADGTFTVEYLSPGHYALRGYGLNTSVSVQEDGSVVSAILQPPTKTGEIGGTLSGAIPDDLRPRGDSIYITAIPKDDQGYNFYAVYQTQYDRATGIYRLRDLPVGTYGVLVSGGRPEVTWVWVPDIEVREGLSRVLPIEIPEGRRVRVIIAERWSLQRPIADCRGWRLRMPSGDRLNTFGVGRIILPPGDYAIEADYGKRGIVTKPFTVELGEDELEVTVSTRK